MLWDPFLYCINDSIQGNSETGNKVFVLPSKVAINNKNWGVKKVATITCIVGTLIAVLVPSNKFEEFLYFIGSIFAPLFAVLFTDYFVLHKKENDRKFDVENIGMWIIGFAIYRVLMNYNTVIGNTLPTILIVMTLKFICNRVKCSIERK